MRQGYFFLRKNCMDLNRESLVMDRSNRKCSLTTVEDGGKADQKLTNCAEEVSFSMVPTSQAMVCA